MRLWFANILHRGNRWFCSPKSSNDRTARLDTTTKLCKHKWPLWLDLYSCWRIYRKLFHGQNL